MVESYNREIQLKANSDKNGEDPLPEAITERFFTGQAANDLFGISVSSAGDETETDTVILLLELTEMMPVEMMQAGHIYISVVALMDNTADVIMTGEAAF